MQPKYTKDNLPPHKGPRGDLDGEDIGDDGWEHSPPKGDPFAGWVTPGPAPALLPDGSPHSWVGRGSEAEAQERLEVRQRIDRRHREQWARVLDSFGPQKRPRPHRWIFADEIADWESGTTMAARAERLKHRPAIYAALACAVASSDFGVGSVHWLPEEFSSLRAEGLRHPSSG
jgi:hypothetical protein